MHHNKRGRWRKPQKHGKPKGLRTGRSWLWDQHLGDLGQEHSVLLQLSSASRLDIPCIPQTAVKPAEKAVAASTKTLLTAYSSPSCASSSDRGWLQGCTKDSDKGPYSYSGGIKCFYNKAPPCCNLQPTPCVSCTQEQTQSTEHVLLQHLYAPAHPKSDPPHGSSAPAPCLDARLCNLSALPAGFYVPECNTIYTALPPGITTP